MKIRKMQGRILQFVGKAHNKGQETQQKQRKEYYLRHEGRYIVSTREKNWQYKAKFPLNGGYVSNLYLQSLYQKAKSSRFKMCQYSCSFLIWFSLLYVREIILFTSVKFRARCISLCGYKFACYRSDNYKHIIQEPLDELSKNASTFISEYN